MNINQIQQFLIIGLGINYAILIFWFLMFLFQHKRFFKLYRNWFKIDQEQFNKSMYWMLGIYKIGVFLFYLVPLIAISLMK